mmetsp:Transcript_12183/g.18490  ORF Transcript_12183/g.18490 Transcript_12183/m.18490 type:complete len:504 (-) Transcript_12183:466-1977(-)
MVSVIEERENSFALLTLRQFSARVSDALLTNPCDESTWERVVIDDNDHKFLSSKDEKLGKEASATVAAGDKLSVIEVPSVKTGRNHTKFNILVLRGVYRLPWDLPPMARQQISWCYRLDHRIVLGPNTCSVNTSAIDGNHNEFFSTISCKLYECFTKKLAEIQEDSLNIMGQHQHHLRIDTYPKSIAPIICKYLQHQAVLGMEASSSSLGGNEKLLLAPTSIDENDPFSGPLNFTLSASRAKYIMSVVQVTESEEYVFGIDTNLYYNKFNDLAAREVSVEPIDAQTGLDLKPLAIEQRHAPTSRAYYKLSQVFDDYILQPDFFSFPTVGSAGLDLGSSPGGWTQVLHSKAKLSKVLSIDPGILAQRVDQLEGVTHCRHDFTSQPALEKLASFSPFSFVVCDASTNATEVFSMIISTFDKVHEKLRREEPGCVLLTCPSNVVITIKMPFKTKGSQTRILKRIRDQLPSTIASMMKWSTASVALYKIQHQMANSHNERTIIILFR